ncbi:F0F1 ATP synthase subunit B [Candidatus Erwinia haradaeae]|uniref:ATP synthase subunit b n=1 Tax=Candidatus Erwinia haradaeae TaxID=1922217 RepID=A0A803FST3_9GAMM|nr:F0F1 ATP synthase subunit B [Candidatus Erwinia haradaeae]VFP87138.1 ATP synthase subunit b [Candidatus Erwinia haradaeae]
MNINATIFGQTIAFIIFVGFCMKYVWPPLMAAIQQRQNEIANAISSADRAKKDLELSRVNAISQIERAKNNAQAILEEAYKTRTQILDEAKNTAMKERDGILTQAQAALHTERQRMHEDLRQQVATLIMEGVKKIIEHSLHEEDHIDIINKIIDELS